jgi:hypothetical protein
MLAVPAPCPRGIGRKSPPYRTVVYPIDSACRRLLWIGPERTARTLLRFFRRRGRERTAALRFVCCDMWPPYLKVIAKKAKQALHILDRYHIVARLNKALDDMRAAEAKELARQGYEPLLTHSRGCFLKWPENLTDQQRTRLNGLLQYGLKTVRAYLLKESFPALWEYTSYHWAGCFLDGWLRRALRSRLPHLPRRRRERPAERAKRPAFEPHVQRDLVTFDQRDVVQQEVDHAFAFPVRGARIAPQPREVGRQRKDLRALPIVQHGPVLLTLLLLFFLGGLAGPQLVVPLGLQRIRDQPVVRINAHVASPGQVRLILRPLHLLTAQPIGVVQTGLEFGLNVERDFQCQRRGARLRRRCLLQAARCIGFVVVGLGVTANSASLRGAVRAFAR